MEHQRLKQSTNTDNNQDDEDGEYKDGDCGNDVSGEDETVIEKRDLKITKRYGWPIRVHEVYNLLLIQPKSKCKDKKKCTDAFNMYDQYPLIIQRVMLCFISSKIVIIIREHFDP
ncbi:hypothetical protein HELRODRAFT_183620 [Helobdella robusta]|uniref:Uncharacterized protein n=1 Tax=Helobdella robusta TaxID=6412 RepID=T1FJY1_HELRO|nr:hypothetical protein HELRODRAFT_183620 [Helobdella robusta]ESO10463.1 hypothetical protein HELRODRAFT_183620 [Helobdella robusta]